MKSFHHIQLKLLFTMIVLSISTIALILNPKVQFARDALKQQAIEKNIPKRLMTLSFFE